MAAKTETVTLLGDTYRITQLGGEVGSDLWDDIIATVGTTLTEKLDGMAAKLAAVTNETQAMVVLGPTLVAILAKVPKDLKKRWRKLFLENTELVTGSVNLNMAKAELFDQHFAGRYDAMTAWELAHIKHNFLGFLGSKPSAESSEQGAK